MHESVQIKSTVVSRQSSVWIQMELLPFDMDICTKKQDVELFNGLTYLVHGILA